MINQHGTRSYHGQSNPLGLTDPILVSRTYRAITAKRPRKTTKQTYFLDLDETQDWRKLPPDGAEFASWSSSISCFQVMRMVRILQTRDGEVKVPHFHISGPTKKFSK
jgi:hypothetical protein